MANVITKKKMSTSSLNRVELSRVDKAATKIISIAATVVLVTFFKCSNTSHSFSWSFRD